MVNSCICHFCHMSVKEIGYPKMKIQHNYIIYTLSCPSKPKKKYILSCIQKVIQVWDDMWVNKWWQILFKCFSISCINWLKLYKINVTIFLSFSLLTIFFYLFTYIFIYISFSFLYCMESNDEFEYILIMWCDFSKQV